MSGCRLISPALDIDNLIISIEVETLVILIEDEMIVVVHSLIHSFINSFILSMDRLYCVHMLLQ